MRLGAHGRSQRAFRPVVGGFHLRVVQEPQHIAPVILQADAVEQFEVVDARLRRIGFFSDKNFPLPASAWFCYCKLRTPFDN